jgi:hypothetical protein
MPQILRVPIAPDVPSRRVCIYCVETKPESAFNREHVMQAAFGLFKDNLVLDCVCKDCNDFFSKDVDLKFTRDSVEGFFRYVTGMKSTADYKSLGPRSTTRVEFREGDSVGAIGYLAPSRDGGADLGFDFAPQFGFSVTEDGPKTWFHRDTLPIVQQLAEHGFDPTEGCFIHTRGMFVEDAAALLASKGYKTNEFRRWYPDDERLATTTVGVISHPEMRAAAKIAMNYLACVAGPAVARSPQFDDVRRFVRHARGWPPVSVTENDVEVLNKEDGRPVRGHYVAVQTQPNGIILAQVSVLLKLKYMMTLSTSPFAIGIPAVSSAHFWDIDARVVRNFKMPPWTPGRELKRVSRGTGS